MTVLKYRDQSSLWKKEFIWAWRLESTMAEQRYRKQEWQQEWETEASFPELQAWSRQWELETLPAFP